MLVSTLRITIMISRSLLDESLINLFHAPFAGAVAGNSTVHMAEKLSL
jgi:hypothetical protein